MIFNILFNEKARKREDNNDTFTYTYKKKRTNIFIMQIVAYFFIFIKRFTQSYEHNLALPVGKFQVNTYTHPISLLRNEERKKGKKVRQK